MKQKSFEGIDISKGTDKSVKVTGHIEDFGEQFPSLKEEMFESIWAAIKKWDIERSPGDLYAGATGDDVRTIISSIEKDIQKHCFDKQKVRDAIQKIRGIKYPEFLLVEEFEKELGL